MTKRFTRRAPPLLALGTIAAGGLALSGCGEAPDENTLFTTPAQCISAGIDSEACNAEYQKALAQHMRGAPRFDSMAACTAQFGAAGCMEAPQDQSGIGGGFFLPLMTGYLISSAVQNLTQSGSYGSYASGGSYRYPTPIYTNRSGATYRSDPVIGTQTAAPRPANVNTRAVSRGGFGGLSSSRSSFGG